jgi:hypothetical protein
VEEEGPKYRSLGIRNLKKFARHSVPGMNGVESTWSIINSIVNQAGQMQHSMTRKKGREVDRAWLWILMNPTFELRSSRKDK